MRRLVLLTATTVLLLSACKKEEQPSEADNAVKSELTLEFDNVAGNQQLALNTGNYTNGAGERFNVTFLQYYISNIRLKKTNGTEFVVPQNESYFLIQEHKPGTSFCKLSVPEGEYKEVSFTIGVDSLRSTKPITDRTGVLDPANYPDGHEGIYWNWNSGYIFLKMEGDSPAAPADPSGAKKYRFHIGGFGGYSSPTANNIRETTVPLTEGNVNVKTGRKPEVHITMDVMKIMKGGSTVSLAANSTVMFGAYSSNVADNYKNAFTHGHTHN
ncbi:MAG: hypothetical protein EOO14_01785 [Chitinophagaceae bacterium]|nr:MAG: hypothetical protein EOO14_01785 [Chitinophagaceae bacterium]